MLHDNYGPMLWGGSGERWELLEGAGPGHQAVGSTAPAPETSPRLEFRRATTMAARGQQLAVELDEHGSSWARTADLLDLDDIPHNWDAARRRLLIGCTDIAPSYQLDQVQASVGWPLFEQGLQSGQGQVILRGILRPSLEGSDTRASFEPFSLGERRGGLARHPAHD